MGYFIRRNDGKFVSQPGELRSYTNNPLRARYFATREAAAKELCYDNEYIQVIEDIFKFNGH